MPEVIKENKSTPVLIKTKHGHYDIAVYDYRFNNFITNVMIIHGVIAWKPILPY